MAAPTDASAIRAVPPMNAGIGLAIVGVGWAGTRQAAAIRELAETGRPRFDIRWLIDPDAEFLAAKAAELGVGRTSTRMAKALSDPSVQAISVCAPHAFHRDLALEAIDAGKHVLVEKPIALTVDDATCMIDAAARKGVALYVAENLVYSAMSRFLRGALVGPNGVGEIAFATVVNGFRAPDFGYEGRRAWLTQPSRGETGTWMLHGLHSMAQLRYVLGEVESVYLREHKSSAFVRRDIEGTLVGTLTLDGGVSVTIVQTCEALLPGSFGGYAIHGERASLRAWKEGFDITRNGAVPIAFTYGDDEAKVLSGIPDLTAFSEYALEMRAFADAVEGVADGPTDGISERRSLAIVQAGYESAQCGSPVLLKARFKGI